MSVFRFRDFQYDSVERRLTRNGEWVELTPKAMDILEVFVERPGQLISRDEIIGKVWGGVLVEEGNLSVHISKLRKALGESREQRYVETVAGSGYRFTGTIEQISNGYAPAHSPNPIHTSNGNGFQGRDSEAVRLVQKGKYLYQKHTADSVSRAIRFFEKSLILDPGNVNTYAELLHSLRFLHFLDRLSIDDLLQKAEPLVETMCLLDDGSDVFHVARGEFELYFRWNFEAALEEFGRAIDVNPENLVANWRLAQVLIYTRQFPKAIQHLPRIAALDPFSIQTCMQMGRFHYHLGKQDAARSFLDEALELDPDNFEVRLLRGTVLAELGELKAAGNELKSSLEIHHSVETISMLGYTSALQGDREIAASYLRELAANDAGSATLTYQARILFAIGEFERGFLALEKAVSNRSAELVGAAVDPRWRFARNSPRFATVLHEIGLQKQPSRSLGKAV